DPVDRPALTEPDNSVGRSHGSWSVFVLRPEDGVQECGGLVQGQIFVGVQYQEFSHRFRSDRFKTLALSFPAENIIDGFVVPPGSGMKAKIKSPCLRGRKDRFNDGTYKLHI